MEERRRLTLEELDERHPRARSPRLRAHPHVGWLLVRSSEHGAVALGANGTHFLAEGRIEGDDPLAPFSPHAPRHLLRTDGFPACRRHHGRELLRLRARRGLRLRGADLVPREASAASRHDRSFSTPHTSRCPRGRSSEPQVSTPILVGWRQELQRVPAAEQAAAEQHGPEGTQDHAGSFAPDSGRSRRRRPRISIRTSWESLIRR